MKRVVFAGSRHRSEVERLLVPVLLRWAASWCLMPDDTLPHIAVNVPDDAMASEWLYHTPSGDIELAMVTGQWPDLVLGAARGVLPEDSVAEHLMRSARHALLEDVAQALRIHGDIVEGRGRTLPFPSQSVVLAINLNQAVLHVSIDAALLPPLTKAAAPVTSLVRRQDALSGAMVDICVELPLMEVAVGDFLGLKPGDIISGQSLLDAVFQVSVGGTRLPLRASLGAQGMHKAIKLNT